MNYIIAYLKMTCLRAGGYMTLLILISLGACAQEEDNNNAAYTVSNGIIHCEKGIPQTPRWFADGRLAFRFDDYGIAQVDYYNAMEGEGLATLFLRQLWDGFRYYLEKDNKTFKPGYGNSDVWPFGIESEWVFENAIIKHRVMAIDESIVIQLIVPENLPAGLHLKMEFFDAFGLTKGSQDDLRFSGGGVSRKWEEWKFAPAENVLAGGVVCKPLGRQDRKERASFETHVVIGASFPLEHKISAVNSKHILRSQALEAGNTYSFCISFGSERSGAIEKGRRLIGNMPRAIEQQFARYRKVAANSPVLESPYKDLNNFISLAPMYHESLKITDHPGAVRAKTSNYWVWGWDGMTSNEATAYWGDMEHFRNLLQFYEATADSSKGIAHAFDYDMKPGSISALPAQGMYISLLQLYYANTGEMDVLKQHYVFAKTIFNRIVASEVKGTGFCEGSSLFPDFPSAMGETGHDISGFNNTIFYCAARSMESLAALTGDKAQQKIALSIIRRFEHNFGKRFFNAGKKFIVSSIDSRTLEQRDSYSTNAIRWENDYCADITDSMDAACLQFFKDNAVTPMGLREIPLWNKSYDMDGNQLHDWWPVTGEYFMRLINGQDQRPLVDQWIKWVSYWTQHLTCPEGISYYIETDRPEFDRWTSQKGTWQAYSMRGWYQAALHGVVGVGTDAGGLTFYPYSGEEMTIRGLNFRNKKFDITLQGSGKYIESIEINGIVVRGSNKLPADLYSGNSAAQGQQVKIVVRRSSVNHYPLYISTGTGIELRDYVNRDGVIRASLYGAGFSRLKLAASRQPVIKVNGRQAHVAYNANLHTASVELDLEPGRAAKIEIR